MTGSIQLSINEFTALARKAVKGYKPISWSMAYESAFAAQYLLRWHLFDLDDFIAALALLSEQSPKPVQQDQHGQNQYGEIMANSPINCGLSLCHYAFCLPNHLTLKSGFLGQYSLPFLYRIVCHSDKKFLLYADDKIYYLDAEGLQFKQNKSDISGNYLITNLSSIEDGFAAIPLHPSPFRFTREALVPLYQFAQNTYAPESQKSRLTGAGAVNDQN